MMTTQTSKVGRMIQIMQKLHADPQQVIDLEQEKSFKESTCEDEPKVKLEKEDKYNAKDLNSSMVLTYGPPADPLLPLMPTPEYYILYELQPKLGFSCHDHQTIQSVVVETILLCQYHFKLEEVTIKAHK